MFEILYTNGIPDFEIDIESIFDYIGSTPFIFIYDFDKFKTGFIFLDTLELGFNIPGFNFTLDKFSFNSNQLDIYSIFRMFNNNKKFNQIIEKPLIDIFNSGIHEGILGFVFIPAKQTEIYKNKQLIESNLTMMDSKISKSFNFRSIGFNSSNSTQQEVFYHSDDKLVLNYILQSINFALAKNGSLYKIFAISSGKDEIENYIKKKFIILDKFVLNINGSQEILSTLLKEKQIVLGADSISYLINFSGKNSVNHTLKTEFPDSTGDILIGKLMRQSIEEMNYEISIDHSILNLGFYISGLPGSGKTRETMSIINQIINNLHIPTIIISPTKEWNQFAYDNSMFDIKLFEDEVPINFFRCPEGLNIEQFYRDLAMLLSVASDAGPYRRPLEKSILNAFRKTYKQNYNPDPNKILDDINDSIIELHGKRTNVGINFTKHGENIKASLENILDLLQNPLYSSSNTIFIEDLIKRGIVFDLSSTSNYMKKLLYSLILNQVYSLISTFDEKGDSELRLLLVVEEAELGFKDKDSPAVEDLKTRIQDFRKKGVGVIFVTHNVEDLDQDLRRLLQIKLYFRQSSDMAQYAMKDLIYEGEPDKVTNIIKHLQSSVAAFSSIKKDGYNKKPLDLIFIKSNFYSYLYRKNPNLISLYLKDNKIVTPKLISCKISFSINVVQNPKIKDKFNQKMSKLSRFNIIYNGAKIFDEPFNKNIYEFKLVYGRKYKFELLDDNYRILFKSDKIIDLDNIYISIDYSENKFVESR